MIARFVTMVRLRVRSLLRGRRVDQDLDEELRGHLEREIDRHIAAGLVPADARVRALRDFGSVAHLEDQCRDQRRITLVNDVLRDVAYGLRSMRRNPGYTAVAALSLALGIGANTAIFTVLDLLMLRSLRVARPFELVELGRVTQYGPGGNFSYPIYERIRDESTSFTGVLTMSTSTVEATLDTEGIQPAGRFVSGNFFELLGVSPAIGRLLAPEDDRPGAAAAVTVIGHGLWLREFGGSPAIVGKTLTISRIPFTIVGVLPDSFEGLLVGRPVDFVLPMASEPQIRRRSWLGNRDFNWLAIVGRLKPGTTMAEAGSDANVVFARFLDEFASTLDNPDSKRMVRSHRLTVESAHAGLSPLRRQFARSVQLLMGAVTLILVIACANVVNLLLARAVSRGREVALRRALGASRGRLVRQLLTEAALLGLMGGALGVWLASWGTRLLVAMIADGDPRLSLVVTPDLRVLLFATIVSLVAALAAGLVPALGATRSAVAPSMQGDGRSLHVSRGAKLWTRALVTAQVALSLLLLVGASLLVASLRNLRTLDAGFDRDRVLLIGINSAHAGFTPERLVQYYRDVLDRVRRIPDVEAASLSLITPVSGGGVDLGLTVEGRPNQARAVVYVNDVMDGYFTTMGTRLLAGRDFTTHDGPGSPPVAVINEALARRFFGTANPLGQRVRLGGLGGLEVVGVVASAKYMSLRESDHPTIYTHVLQRAGRDGLSLSVRTVGEPLSVAPAIRRVVRMAASAVQVGPGQSLSVQVDRSIVRERLVARILVVFAGLALVLASVGLYGVLGYAVTRRTSEIGVRLALGATRASVLWSVVREAWGLVALGAAMGVAAALALAHVVSTLLYDVTPADPKVLGGAVASLFLVALAAAWIPAWRASRVDPLVALRHE